MDKILKKLLTEEFKKLKYKEVLYEGEVRYLVERELYRFNILNTSVELIMDKIYADFYTLEVAK